MGAKLSARHARSFTHADYAMMKLKITYFQDSKQKRSSVVIVTKYNIFHKVAVNVSNYLEATIARHANLFVELERI